MRKIIFLTILLLTIFTITACNNEKTTNNSEVVESDLLLDYHVDCNHDEEYFNEEDHDHHDDCEHDEKNTSVNELEEVVDECCPH